MVHGDDFLAWETQDKLGKVLSEAYELKCVGILGDEDRDRKEAHFLNRLIRADEKNGKSSVVIEADRRHVDCRSTHPDICLEKLNGVESPDIKKSSEQQMLESRRSLLDKSDASRYRSATMRAAYLAQDCMDIGHAVKNLARGRATHAEARLASEVADPLPHEQGVSGRGASLQFTTNANQVASAS